MVLAASIRDYREPIFAGFSVSPFVFNPWKHHANFLCTVIRQLGAPGVPDEALRSGVGVIGASLGGNVLDLYLGELFPRVVREELALQLRDLGCLEAECYAAWLGERRGCGLLELSDGSRWVLRAARALGGFIHIHPGRDAPFCLRVSANTLKSAFAVLVWSRRWGVNPLELGFVNETRGDLLGLSPLGELSAGRGLGGCIRRLGEFLEVLDSRGEGF